MPYIQNRVYTEDELGLGDVSDWLKKMVGWTAAGAAAELAPAAEQPPVTRPAYTPPSFIQQYGTVLLLGGAGLALFLILRKK